jgi:hypothetical protein
MRRRLRERKREREARLLDLGALVYELHRQGKRAPELLQDKAAELAIVDQEVRDLEAALDGGEVLDLNEREPEPGDTEQTQEADALEPEAEHEPEDDHEPEDETEEPEDHLDRDEDEEPRP